MKEKEYDLDSRRSGITFITNNDDATSLPQPYD